MRNSFDNNELHLYTELHNDEQMLMFRPTMALEGPVARSYFDGTWPWQCAVVLGASARRQAGPHRGPRLPGVGGRPEASLQATREIAGAPRVAKSPLVMCPPPPRRRAAGTSPFRGLDSGRAVPGRLHARVGGAGGRLLAPFILWSLVAYKLLGPSAQPLQGRE